MAWACPQATFSSVSLPTATAPLGINLLCHGFSHGCSPSREVPALMWDYPWPNTCRCSSMDLSTGTDVPVSTCCSTALSLGLHSFRLLHCHSHFQVVLTDTDPAPPTWSHPWVPWSAVPSQPRPAGQTHSESLGTASPAHRCCCCYRSAPRHSTAS